MEFSLIPNKKMTLSEITADIYCRDPEGKGYLIGRAFSMEPLLEIYENMQGRLNFLLPLDHYGLSQIEKIRQNRDLKLWLNLRFVCQVGAPSVVVREVNFESGIAKSDWVEKFLPEFKYKDVLLMEIPKLIDAKFKEISGHLNEAWKQYSMGTYDSVLVKCRKALEALSTIAKKAGYKTTVKNKEGKEETVPDWNKLAGSKKIGEIIKSIYRKTRGFVAPGAHAGKAINREDADFALMVTYALVNLATRKLLEEK
jgi:hypothetical protein